MNAPCRNCVNRWVHNGKTCHTECEKYLKFVEQNRKLLDKVKKEKDLWRR